mmetsp:Transcript_8504/g.14419  ORF Transcript_8504/g.14419 Transcript_8504/m.14419 type:complete len:182 (-) Transcript_8504:183-728(-)|eukprot:CAMPEP_0114427722 /NCGR_PEP_ID=MMETSP0103-20121206/8517_1 /TAXON_ID=37642 ORGANISM="Paraphysomonas imperforata, Strain PA2" /NCGR_SAMPLE_ID=MMETSP0103 /ASSEMBLY_ACC=CAM_ASM_000201 /LENGTH=181 /DNA_ID=CAMNT_0001596837 /DNA_START=65 /DNA_END=610 /DNA_ORIENTATION=+
MNLAPDDRVNMSLDAIIKTNKQAKKAEMKVKNPKSAATKGLKSTSEQKNAKNVGQSKAKRAAAIDQKRGLNASGKASTQQIKAAGKKQVAKVQAKKPAVKTAALKAQKSSGTTKKSGLRISFKPADLGKTTDKTMAAQIRGVLSKDPSSKKSVVARPTSAQGGRKVVQAKAPPKKKIVIRR